MTILLVAVGRHLVPVARNGSLCTAEGGVLTIASILVRGRRSAGKVSIHSDSLVTETVVNHTHVALPVV